MKRRKILKFLDKIMGLPVLWLLPAAKGPRPNSFHIPKRILVIRPGGIGDAVLLIPALKTLKKKFPDAEIDVLCETRNCGVFKLAKEVSKVYTYDKGLGLFRCLGQKYDVTIDTEQWHRLSALISLASRAPLRIGFATNERRKAFSLAINYDPDAYEVNSFLDLIEPLVGTRPVFDADKPFIETDRIPSAGKIISIFPGSSRTEKRWNPENFARIAGDIAALGYTVVLLGSKKDEKICRKISKQAVNCVDLSGQTTLAETASILRSSKLMLTADSGLMHIAYGVGTPTVAIFGPGNEKKWAPKGKNCETITKMPPNSPRAQFGYIPNELKNGNWLDSVTVEEVKRKLEKFL